MDSKQQIYFRRLNVCENYNYKAERKYYIDCNEKKNIATNNGSHFTIVLIVTYRALLDQSFHPVNFRSLLLLSSSLTPF